MANTTVTYQIFGSIVKALSGLKVKTYLQNRPKQVADKLDSFIVVDLPVTIQHATKGYDDYQYNTTAVIYAFSRAKTDGTPNIDKQTDLVRKISNCFPITDKYIECVNPRILLRGLDDKTDFHVTSITFSLRTKVNAFIPSNNTSSNNTTTTP